MKQERNNNHYTYFYRDETGIRRRYGIYAPSIDRFLHISDQDMWMSLETAELLSSKIQTMVYVLPPGYITPDHQEIVSNKNCTEWGIYDKSNLTIGSSNVLGARQTPAIKMLYPDDKLVHYDQVPEDFIEDSSQFNRLKEYVDYLYPRVVALNISSTFYNPYLTKKFTDKYLDQDWSDSIQTSADHSQVKGGIDNTIKNIFYKSETPQEAENSIIQFWLKNYWDMGYMITGYYKMLGIPVPAQLKPYAATTIYLNHSVWTI